MVGLTLVDRIGVKFRGERGGDGPLTFAQRNTLQWVVGEAAQTIQSMLPWVFDTSGRLRLDDVAEVFAVLMSRHESLRTTYHGRGDAALQRVAESGELVIDVYHAAGSDEAVAFDLATRMRARPFDLAGELPVRVGVVTAGGADPRSADPHSALVRAVVAVYTHMAVDFGALSVINDQFSALIADPACRVVGPLRHQPLDQAAYEQSERGRRRNERALSYWEQQLWRRPQYQFPMPPEDRPRPLSGLLLARRATAALPRVMERTGTSAPAVTLAAMCAVLAKRTGQRHIVFSSLSNNRSGRLRDYVGTVAQDSLVMVDADAARFDELARRVGTATLKATRHSLYDPHGLERLALGIEWRRGMRHSRDCAFNNLSAHELSEGTLKLHSAQISSAREDGSVGWKEPDFDPVALRFAMVKWEEQFLLDVSTGHCGWLPATEIEALVGAVERLIVAAAAEDVDLDRLTDITGIEPIRRDADWHTIENSWIQLSAVQAMLEDALPGCAPHAVIGADSTVTAYLVATDAVDTPSAAHGACMAILRRHATAIAPAHYVLCDAAPADLAEWPKAPVRAEGAGR